jgi:hypothetical protein
MWYKNRIIEKEALKGAKYNKKQVYVSTGIEMKELKTTKWKFMGNRNHKGEYEWKSINLEKR